MRKFVLLLLVYLYINYPAQAATFKRNGDLIGEVTTYKVKKEDNLYEVARQHDLGIVELLAANPGVDVWTPKKDTLLTLTTSHVLPKIHNGIVINLSELRLFYFVDENTIMTFPIGIGSEGWSTPTGTTKITLKRKDPTWTPPDSIREENPELPDIIPPGPDNPLGAYALNLGLPRFAIHGTNRPYGVGKRSSHGCIRLYPEDIEILFNAVSTGTQVTIVDTPYKIGWQGDTMFLEVTQTQKQSDTIAAYRVPARISMPDIHNTIRQTAGDNAVIDWFIVDHAINEHSGIPVAIGERIK